MTSVKAVRWHGPRDVQLDRVDLAGPGPAEVISRCAYRGVCGSDLHEIDDGPHVIPTDIRHHLSGAVAPIIIGHEFSGYVAKIGEGVTGPP